MKVTSRFITSGLKFFFAILIFQWPGLSLSDENLSPYQSVKKSNSAFRFNINGEWIAAEKIPTEAEMQLAITTISKWKKSTWVSNFCLGLGKTFQSSFQLKRNELLTFNLQNYGGDRSVMGCEFMWLSPKGNTFKTISTVEKGPDNIMYMFTLFR